MLSDNLSEQDSNVVSHSILINSLIDVYLENGDLLNSESQDILSHSVNTKITDDEREFLIQKLHEYAQAERGEFQEFGPEISRIMNKIGDGLKEENIDLGVDHRLMQEFSPIHSAIYSFMGTLDATVFDGLRISSDAMDRIKAGAVEASSDQFEDAASLFVESIGVSTSENGKLVGNILASWAFFKSGEEEKAQHHADAALQIDSDSWVAKLVWIIATYNQADRIHTGELSVGVVFKMNSGVDDTGEIDIDFGLMSDNRITWHEPTISGQHGFVNQLSPTTFLRFRISGRIGELPVLDSYFIGLGVFDHVRGEITEVERVFTTGPESGETIEKISLLDTSSSNQ